MSKHPTIVSLFFLIIIVFSHHSQSITVPVYDINITEQGTLYLGTATGLQRYNGIQVSEHQELVSLGIKERLIWSVDSTEDAFLLGTNNGLYIKQQNRLDQLLANRTIYDISRQANGNYLIATSQGVATLNWESRELAWLNSQVAAHIVTHYHDRIFIGTYNGLIIYQADGTVFDHLLMEDAIWDLVSSDDQLIILSNRNTYRYHFNDHRLEKINQFDDPYFRRGVIDAKRQVIWLADDQGQIHLRDLQNFQSQNHEIRQHLGLVYQLAIDPFGNVYAATAHGLVPFHAPIIKNLPDMNQGRFIARSDQHLAICNDYSVYVDGVLVSQLNTDQQRVMDCFIQNKQLFIATSRGLWKYDIAQHSAQYLNPNNGAPILSVKQSPNDNNLLLGTLDSGLLEITEQGIPLHRYGEGYIIASATDPHKELFIMIGKTLVGFKKNQTTPYFTLDLSHYLLANVVDMWVTEDDIYLGSYGDGLIRINRDTAHIQRFDQQHGLANSIVVSLLVQERGHVWLGTLAGLALLDGERIYMVGDAFQFTLGSLVQTQGGNILAGSQQGIKQFNSQEVLQALDQPITPYLDRLQIGDGPIQYHPRQITLENTGDQVRLQAALSNLLAYGYRLEYLITGYHQQWQALNVGEYFSLPRQLSGSHYLSIRIVGNHRSTQRYPLIITRPWYLDPATMIMGILGVFGLTAGTLYQYCFGTLKQNKSNIDHTIKAINQERSSHRVFFSTILSRGIRQVLETILKNTQSLSKQYTTGLRFQGQMTQALQQPIADMQQLCHYLSHLEQLYYPSPLGQLGFYQALQQEIQLRVQLGYKVTLSGKAPSKNPNLSAPDNLALYQLCIDLVEQCHHHAEPVGIHVYLNTKTTHSFFLECKLNTPPLDHWLNYHFIVQLPNIASVIHFDADHLLLAITPNPEQMNDHPGSSESPMGKMISG